MVETDMWGIPVGTWGWHNRPHVHDSAMTRQRIAVKRKLKNEIADETVRAGTATHRAKRHRMLMGQLADERPYRVGFALAFRRQRLRRADSSAQDCLYDRHHPRLRRQRPHYDETSVAR